MTRKTASEAPAKVRVERYTIAPPHMCEVRLTTNVQTVENEDGITAYEWDEYFTTHPYSEGLAETIEANFETWLKWIKERDLRSSVDILQVSADVDFLMAMSGLVV